MIRIFERFRQRSFAKSESSESKKREEHTGRTRRVVIPRSKAHFSDVGIRRAVLARSRTCLGQDEMAQISRGGRRDSGKEGRKEGRKGGRGKEGKCLSRDTAAAVRLRPTSLASAAVILILLRVSASAQDISPLTTPSRSMSHLGRWRKTSDHFRQFDVADVQIPVTLFHGPTCAKCFK